MAHVADADGGMRRARVCTKCFDNALHIVAHIVRTEKPVNETAAQRREAKTILKGAIKKLEGIVRAYEATGKGDPEVDAQVSGLVQAIGILEAGDY